MFKNDISKSENQILKYINKKSLKFKYDFWFQSILLFMCIVKKTVYEI